MEAKTSGRCADRDLLRQFWWLMLASAFDECVQREGVIVVQNLLDTSTAQFYTGMAHFYTIDQAFNEMFYGAMPFKMKWFILVGSPWWLNMLVGFMRLFM